MIVTARVIVRYNFEKDSEGNPREENWGCFDFEHLPRQGEWISLYRDHENHDLLVKVVEHSGISNPRPQTGMKTIDDDEPSTRLLVDWEGSE